MIFLNYNYMTLKSKTRCEQDPRPGQIELKMKKSRRKQQNNAKRKPMVDEENTINKHVKRECRSSFRAFKYQIVGFLLLLFEVIWIHIPWVFILCMSVCLISIHLTI